eukprot:CAMPEP_0174266082 /NCGR_PEP_ID=MMETSP0439-20130205/28872_1 /TAXON_ID=0 /ORGANISM="Stereomyxa ramosa, Strain Chinc5" /LENGTH=36 /DNA_ID= /DNA_START= /DNA_END= /DNA_ORIENTATION=
MEKAFASTFNLENGQKGIVLSQKKKATAFTQLKEEH